jgi:hypothetical protein
MFGGFGGNLERFLEVEDGGFVVFGFYFCFFGFRGWFLAYCWHRRVSMMEARHSRRSQSHVKKHLKAQGRAASLNSVKVGN